MLRWPGSRYESGRSSTLLKVKSFHDAEARVIGHQGGAGRHKGRLGALLVELDDGTRFAVGSGFSDAERENPPAIGSVITFRYQELSDGGVPRFPSFVGVREESQPPEAKTAPASVKAAKIDGAPAAAPAWRASIRRGSDTGRHDRQTCCPFGTWYCLRILKIVSGSTGL
jgi:DNA ligase 1